MPRESRFNESHSHKMVIRHSKGRKDPEGLCLSKCDTEPWAKVRIHQGAIQTLSVFSHKVSEVLCHHCATLVICDECEIKMAPITILKVSLFFFIFNSQKI